jgi:hypothetical protein
MLESREWERAKECVCLSPCCALLCVVFVLVNCLRIYWENKLIKKEKKKVRFDLFILVLGRGITLWNDLQHPRLYIYYSYSYSYTALPKITYYYYSILYKATRPADVCGVLLTAHSREPSAVWHFITTRRVYSCRDLCAGSPFDCQFPIPSPPPHPKWFRLCLNSRRTALQQGWKIEVEIAGVLYII